MDLCTVAFDPLPNNNILDVSKMEAFADDKLKVARLMISLFDSEGNIVGKEENTGYQNFLFFPCSVFKSSLV